MWIRKIQKQSFPDVLQNRYFKILQCSQENTCIGVLQAYNSIKKRLLHRCISVKFLKFLKPQNFMGHFRWLHLEMLHQFSIAHENDEWCNFLVRIGSPELISFDCVCFVSFFFSYFSVDFTTC